VNKLQLIGYAMKAKAETMRNERGELNIGGILVMGIGMVFLAVGFIIFPIVTDSTDALLDWTCTDNATYTDASFTGFTEVVGITPLLVLVGFLAAGVFSMYLGIRISKGQATGGKVDLGTLIMLALAMIFIAIALIILPVALEAICTVLSNGDAGLNAAYVGLEPILLVTPLLVLVAFLGGAVIAGFFGIKNLGASGGD